MKRILTLGFAMLLSITTFAQGNVTKFLGIPVDGTKNAMISKLKAKGYTYNINNDYLEGEFNGQRVHIYVVTNNNKVYRIMVTDANGKSEGEIKIRFNTLCRQFAKNEKYIPQNMYGAYEIEDETDISYEMAINNRRFQAAYYQVSQEDKDTTGFVSWAKGNIGEKYTEEEIEKMSEKEYQTMLLGLLLDYANMKVSNKSVWFMINEIYGDYYISLFYDNELNMANGEDL